MMDSSTHRSTDSVDETVDLLLLLADLMDKQSVRVDIKPTLLRDLADLIIDLRYDAERSVSPLAAASAEVSALQDAADEIERLRAIADLGVSLLKDAATELADWQRTVRAHEHVGHELRDEVERLRSALRLEVRK